MTEKELTLRNYQLFLASSFLKKGLKFSDFSISGADSTERDLFLKNTFNLTFICCWSRIFDKFIFRFFYQSVYKKFLPRVCCSQGFKQLLFLGENLPELIKNPFTSVLYYWIDK